MEERTMDTLMRRLERVERDNLRWKVLWSAAAAVLGLVFLLGATKSQKAKVADEIRAGRFIVVDRDGKPRAELSVGPNGKVGLALADQNEKIRAGLGVASDGTPGLALADKNGMRRATLVVRPDGTVRLDLTDKGGTPRAELALSDDGLPHLALLNKDEKSSAWLTVSHQGSPALILRDKDGNTRALQVARKELEQVPKEKLRAEAETDQVNRDVAQTKMQLASVSKKLMEMQEQVNRLQQELSVTQQKLKRERQQEAVRREDADRYRKDAAQVQRRLEELDKTSEERDYFRLVNEALAYTYRKGPGDAERAETAYRNAVQIAQAKNIRDPVVYNAYAVFLQDQKRFEEAEKFYKMALEVNPSYGKALYNLGTLYEVRGDLKEALEKYKAADEAGVKQARENYLHLRSILKQ
ncbi:MAG: tetratricopeptide repeat protein [candidate division NC10 bacterium]